jgi:alpha-beta hydrolase superfamily lysophospholipase
MKVPALKEAAARIAVKWMPTLTLYNEIKYEDLTRDEEMRKSYAKDNLRHDKISPGVFLSMLENFPLALQNAAEIQQPVLMQLAGDDKITSSDASRELFEKFPNKKSQLELYPDSYHEVYNDLDRDKAIADLKKFIHPYLGA